MKTLTIKHISILILLILAPLISIAGGMYITSAELNVRAGAGKQYAVLFSLQKGDEVEVLTKKGRWFEIRYQHQVGYAYSKYLHPVSANEPDTSQQSNNGNSGALIIGLLILLGAIGSTLFKRWMFEKDRKARRDYYRNVYLNSEEWQRKRYVVLKRDNWRCVYCGEQATQVHHKRYAKYNIGKEPIDWLVSVCASCHGNQHN